MTAIQLVHHLMWLFLHCAPARHHWLAYYRWHQPGMPRGWYSMHVRGLIAGYPHAMQGCLVHLQYHLPYSRLYPYCP